MPLIGQWAFEDADGNGTDTSVNGNTATFQDGAAQNVSGSADLDGVNDYIEIDDSAAYSLSSGTIHGTFTPAIDSFDNGTQTLVSRDSNGYDDGGHLTIFLESDGSITVRHQSDNQNYYINTDPGLITEGEPFDLVYSFSDTGGLTLYVDGVEVGSNTDPVTNGDSISMSGNTEPWTLGASQAQSGDGVADNLNTFFEGTVGHFEIYDEALPPSQLTTIHDLSDGVDDGVIEGTSGDDTIHGGDSAGTEDGGLVVNDTINAGDGNDVVYAGDGDDVVAGGTGQDTLFGGSGEDSLTGGAGDDSITTGAGNDTVSLDQFGGNDTVSDFDIGDDDLNGQSNDQLDVSELRDLSGGAVSIWDVTVSDDGTGNAVLTFPEGETVTLQGVTPAQMTPAQMVASGIPCFTAGTLILTPDGERLVEDLRPGDLIMTRDNGPQPILWCDSRSIGPAELIAKPNLRPVFLSADWTGTGRDLLVSPQHGIVVNSKDMVSECLARASQLARISGGKIRVAHGTRQVKYVHLLLPQHNIIFSNGVATESFYPGPRSVGSLSSCAALSLAALLPRLARDGVIKCYGDPALPYARFRDLPIKLSMVSSCQFVTGTVA